MIPRITLPLVLLAACDDAGPTSADDTAATAAPLALSTAMSVLTLQGESSVVGFTSYKDDMVPVGFRVHQPAGTLGIYDGSIATAFGKIIVPLEGIDSALELRDDRVMNVFFGMSESNRYVTFDFDGLQSVTGSDGSWDVEVEGLVAVGGVSQVVTADLHIEQTAGQVHLTTNSPLVLSIEGFGLGDNLDALMQLCGHSTVADDVDVAVDLRFDLVE